MPNPTMPSMMRPIATAAKPAPKMTLASITKGKRDLPPRLVVYGVPGVGKTTFALSAPSPVVIPAEPGIDKWPDVPQFPAPTTFQDVLEALHSLDSDGHQFKSVIVDTLDALEPLVWAEVVRKDSPDKNGHRAANIEEVGGGFQKGYIAAVDEWRLMINALERLHNRGMWVVIVDHSAVRNFKNPQGPDYERYGMKIHPLAGAAFYAWADAQLFAQFETHTAQFGRKYKGVSKGVRVFRCERTASYDAKNRLSLPDPLPVAWDDFEAAWRAGQVADPASFRGAIAEAMAALAGQIAEDDQPGKEAHEKFSAVVAAEVEKSGENANRLAQILNKLNARLAKLAETELTHDR